MNESAQTSKSYLDLVLNSQRLVPKQGRAHQCIEAILDATEKLLGDGALVTTSTIAKEAEIPVGSIYRYFPNIMGIYAAVFAKLNDGVDSQLTDLLMSSDTLKSESMGWRELFQQLMATIGDEYRQHPALPVLLRLSSRPELQPITLASKARMAAILEARFQAGRNGFHGGDPKAVANTIIELIAWLEMSLFAQAKPTDLTPEGSAQDVFYTEGVKAIEAYLSLYFKD